MLRTLEAHPWSHGGTSVFPPSSCLVGAQPGIRSLADPCNGFHPARVMSVLPRWHTQRCAAAAKTPATLRRHDRRDEPGSGGVRVGQTRSDLDCRVVATSRRVAPTECDSRLPFSGRGSTCRLRLLDSWPPPGSGVVFDSSRGSTRVSRPVAPTESDSSDKRRTWAV